MRQPSAYKSKDFTLDEVIRALNVTYRTRIPRNPEIQYMSSMQRFLFTYHKDNELPMQPIPIKENS